MKIKHNLKLTINNVLNLDKDGIVFNKKILSLLTKMDYGESYDDTIVCEITVMKKKHTFICILVAAKRKKRIGFELTLTEDVFASREYCLGIEFENPFIFYKNRKKVIGFENCHINSVNRGNCNIVIKNKEIKKFIPLSGTNVLAIVNKFREIFNVEYSRLLDASTVHYISDEEKYFNFSLARLYIFKFGKTWYQYHLKGAKLDPVLVKLINSSKKLTIKSFFKNIQIINCSNKKNITSVKKIMKKIKIKQSDTVSAFIVKLMDSKNKNVSMPDKINTFNFFTKLCQFVYFSVMSKKESPHRRYDHTNLGSISFQYNDYKNVSMNDFLKSYQHYQFDINYDFIDEDAMKDMLTIKTFIECHPSIDTIDKAFKFKGKGYKLIRKAVNRSALLYVMTGIMDKKHISIYNDKLFTKEFTSYLTINTIILECTNLDIETNNPKVKNKKMIT